MAITNYNLLKEDSDKFLLETGDELLSEFQDYSETFDAGSFTLTGIVVALNKLFHVAADVGAFILTGIDAVIMKVIAMTVSVGAFTLTGIASTLTASRAILTTVGEFILTGVSLKFRNWDFQHKNTTSFTGGTKHTTSFSGDSKNTTNWTNQSKS